MTAEPLPARIAADRRIGAGAVLLLALLYYAAARLGLALAVIHPSASAVWPPSGIAMAALLLGGLRLWPGVFLGALAANVGLNLSVGASLGAAWAGACGVAAGNTLEAVIGAWFVGRYAGGSRFLLTGEDVLRFAFGAALVAPLASAGMGAGTLWAVGLAQPETLGAVAYTWFLGDSVGILLLTPMIVAWATAAERWRWPQWAELGAILVIQAVFELSEPAPGGVAGSLPLGFPAIPLLLWAVFRLGLRGGTTAAAAYTAAAVWGAISSPAPPGWDLNDALTLLQAFLGGIALLTLAMAAVLEQRERARRALEDEVVRQTRDLLRANADLRQETAELQRTQDLLTESEAQLRAVYDSAPDVIFTLSPDGRILSLSPSFERSLGRRVEDWVGNEWAKIVHHEDVPGIAEGFGRVLQHGQEARVSGRVQRGDGSWVVYEATVRPLRPAPDAPVTALLGIARDVTAARALEDARARLAAIFDSTDDAVVTMTLDGRITGWNRGAERVYERSAEAALGTDFRRLFPRERLHEAEVILETMRKGLHLQHFETVRLKADGSKVDVSVTDSPIRDATGEVVAVSEISRDVSARKASEQALRASEARLRRLIDSNLIGIVWFDFAAGRTEANDALLAMLGFSRDDVRRGRIDWLGLTPREWRDATERATRAMRERGSSGPYEKELLRKDGSLVPVLVSQALLEESPDRGVAFVMDLSALKKAEADLRAKTSELERSNRELEQFAYVASHDLQEPLRKIVAFGDRLRELTEGKLPAGAQDAVERMQSAAARMSRLIVSLLEFSKVAAQPPAARPVDLDQTLREVLGDMEVAVAEAGADVRVEPLPPVLGDPVQMHELFQNLLGNAIKFRRPQEHPRVLVTGALVGGMVEIRVADDGIGIDPRFAEQVFEPFRRLHGRGEYEGSGMGLAICRKIAERNGGTVHAEARPTPGATLVVRLPAAPEPGKEKDGKKGTRADRR